MENLFKVNIELPSDDPRSIKIWYSELKDNVLNLSVSIEDAKNSDKNTNKTKPLVFLQEIIEICRAKDAEDKAKNPSLKGESWIVFQLELLKKLVEKQEEMLKLAANNQYPWELLKVRSEMEKEGVETAEECSEVGLECFCSKGLIDSELDKYYNIRREITNYLKEN